MAKETSMSVLLIGQTKLAYDFFAELLTDEALSLDFTDGQAIALSAIRTCYSPNQPSKILNIEGSKYFGSSATDGEGGTEADRLIRHIMKSGHTSTMEHISFTFAIEGVSRALLAQLTRHRVGFGYSVQSQRYVRLGSNDKSGGFSYVVPKTIAENPKVNYSAMMDTLQHMYDLLREAGVPAEDARSVLPQSTACNLVMTVNLRALLEFYKKRQKGRGAQGEIAELAEKLREAVVEIEPWTSKFFEEV